MQDGEIVHKILAKDPAGLEAAYDTYARGLYAYCQTLLSQQADAADAVQDTFVVAATKLVGLRDPARLRPWLYAVARNECFRRLRARGLSAPLDAVGEMTSDEEDMGAGAEREELRGLVVDALAGLNPGDREVIELNLRHVLEGEDLADALGVSRNQAHALASRARAQFEGSLGALLVARTGRDHCEELDTILSGWDGEMTVLLRKRVNRHVQHCEICGARKKRELSPAMLLSMLPMVALPSFLRERVLRLVADSSPIAADHREVVARRAEPFERSGFPKPISTPRRVYGAQAMTVAAGVAVVAALLLGVGTVFALGALHHKGPATADAATLAPKVTSHAPLASGSHRVSGSHHHSRTGQAGLTATTSPTPTVASQSPPAGPTTPPASPTPSQTPTTAPPTTPPPTPGTLAASPTQITLTQPPAGGPYSGSFTLTAQGGPVTGWNVNDPAPAGDLLISPSSGSLTSGQSVTVTVTVNSDVGLQYQTNLTVNPGGLTVIVFYPPAG